MSSDMSKNINKMFVKFYPIALNTISLGKINKVYKSKKFTI